MSPSSPLTFGIGKDGAPNALFDPLSRVVCSFPTDRATDTRRGSPSTPETILANAQLFAAAHELLAVLELIHANAGESPEWIRARIAPAIAKAKGGAL